MHACMEQKLCGLGYGQNLQQRCLANIQQMEAEGQEKLLKDWMLINHHHSICQPQQYP